MIDEFKKEIVSKIISFCQRKTEKHNIPKEMLDEAIMGCSLVIINEMKDEAIRLIGVTPKNEQ